MVKNEFYASGAAVKTKTTNKIETNKIETNKIEKGLLDYSHEILSTVTRKLRVQYIFYSNSYQNKK